jgi:hypothetical protein
MSAVAEWMTDKGITLVTAIAFAMYLSRPQRV